MIDLASLAPCLNAKKRQCRALIKTPKGSRNKFKYDETTHVFMLGEVLPQGMVFPFDFGFIPSTLGPDGDPVDMLVLMDAPTHAGCLIEVRILGVIELRKGIEARKLQKTST